MQNVSTKQPVSRLTAAANANVAVTKPTRIHDALSRCSVDDIVELVNGNPKLVNERGMVYAWFNNTLCLLYGRYKYLFNIVWGVVRLGLGLRS